MTGLETPSVQSIATANSSEKLGELLFSPSPENTLPGFTIDFVKAYASGELDINSERFLLKQNGYPTKDLSVLVDTGRIVLNSEASWNGEKNSHIVSQIPQQDLNPFDLANRLVAAADTLSSVPRPDGSLQTRPEIMKNLAEAIHMAARMEK